MPFLASDEPLHRMLTDAGRGERLYVLWQRGHRVHSCRVDEPQYVRAAMQQRDFADGLRSLLRELESAPTLTATGRAIADRLAPLLSAQYSNLAIVDAGRLRIIHGHNLAPPIADKYPRVPIDHSTPLGMAASTCLPVVLPSLAAYEPSFGHMIDDTRAAGLAATISVPLSDAPPSAVIGIGWSEPLDGKTTAILRVLTNIAESCHYALRQAQTRGHAAHGRATAVGPTRSGTRDRRAKPTVTHDPLSAQAWSGSRTA